MQALSRLGPFWSPYFVPVFQSLLEVRSTDPGDMPAKSIASFFSKPAAKKPTEEVKDEGKENRAITKDPTSGAAER